MRAQYNLSPYIPDDFPLLQISQDALDRLWTQLADWTPLPEATSALVEDLYPLSGMQAGLLFHSQASGLYVEQQRFHLEGTCHVPALIQSWEQMLAAHPILRTSFVGEEALVQVVWRRVALPLTIIDATGLSPQEQEALLHAAHQADRQRGFVPQQAPLLRLCVVRLGPQRHHLLWSFHHAILDGWSVALLLQEFFARYQALSQGRQPQGFASRPYREYIAWLQQQDQQVAEAFWRQQLAGITAPTPLPLNASYARSQPDGEPGYGQQKRRLGQAVSQRLQTVARDLHITVNTLLQASWACVLSRYSGQAEVLFGMVVAGRQAELAGVESLVGLCINTVPVRVSIPRAGTVSDWLRQVHDYLASLQRYSYTPLWQIQRLGELDAGQSLFQSLFIFENYPVEHTLEQLQHTDLRLRESVEEEVPEQTNYALTATVLPGEQIELEVSYQEQALEPELVNSMLALWQQVLEAIVQQPDQPVAALPLLTKVEQAVLGQEWQGRRQSYPQSWFPQLFAQQVERSPEAVALVCEQQQLTYRELNRRANQLAHHLQGLGVGPEVLVGLCVQRSPELIVGILGILKAGGVYVPLDPEYPQQRLAFLLADTQMPVLLTQHPLLERLPQAYQGQVVCLDRDGETLRQQSQDNPLTRITGDNLAYVIYTSGSTGQPKGVLMTHQALAAYCWSMVEAYHLRAEDHVLQFSTFTFDASLEQILPSLLAGARLLLRGSDVWPPAELLEQIQHEALTVMDLPTAYWHQVAQEEMPEAAGSLAAHLRLLTVGGERLLMASLQRWQHTPLGGVRLLNTYGPTETTITATLYDTTGDTGGSHSGESVPIGRPLPNRSSAILDQAGHPVPLGIVGEFALGGEMLARGYLNRPELTAEAFVPDPFSGQPGARLYRTGDLVRRLADGNLQFVGRNDQQVKLRGFRIELGEIEQVLLEHPDVRESAVVAHTSPAGDLQLVAYVVPVPQEDEKMNWWETLRAFLRERLPEYMLPSHLVPLEALPLTASGKVNRHALLTHRPEEGKQQPHERQQPRDGIELRLLRIWERVLERGPISLTDSFFHQGGHSLAALRLHAQIQNEFQRQLPLGLLFQYPTIRELAQILRREIGYVRGSALVPLQPHGPRTPFFCVHPGGGSVFCYLDLVRHLGMSYPVYGLQVPEMEEGQAIASVEQLAAHYVAALRTVQPEEPYLLGGWSAGGIIAYEMAFQLRHQGHDVALLCLFDSHVPSGQRTQEQEHDSTLTEFLVAWGFEKQKVSSLTKEEQLQAAYDVFKQELMLPDGLDLAYVERFIHLQSDIGKAVEAYGPPPSDQHITLIRVEQEREQASRSAQDGREPELDSTYGWNAVTKANIDVYSVPGAHNEMFSEPYVQRVASILQTCLDERDIHQERSIS